jgi:hypothetical protein
MGLHNLLTFQIVDTTDSFLGVLNDLGKEKCESSSGDLGRPSLVKISVIYVWAVGTSFVGRGQGEAG